MPQARLLHRNEIKDIWRIDRSEVIDSVYHLVDGRLVLSPERHEPNGWPAGQPEKDTPILEACFDWGGWFYGIFDDDQPIGVVVLDGRPFGPHGDRVQLMFLHVGNPFRDKGFGRRLFNAAADEANRRGARSLYVSATPSEHTVDFYLGLGCMLADSPEPGLFELEPKDIHLEFDLRLRGSA